MMRQFEGGLFCCCSALSCHIPCQRLLVAQRAPFLRSRTWTLPTAARQRGRSICQLLTEEHPRSCGRHMQPASPAWYATCTLLPWRPLPASGCRAGWLLFVSPPVMQQLFLWGHFPQNSCLLCAVTGKHLLKLVTRFAGGCQHWAEAAARR